MQEALTRATPALVEVVLRSEAAARDAGGPERQRPAAPRQDSWAQEQGHGAARAGDARSAEVQEQAVAGGVLGHGEGLEDLGGRLGVYPTRNTLAAVSASAGREASQDDGQEQGDAAFEPDRDRDEGSEAGGGDVVDSPRPGGAGVLTSCAEGD